MAYGAATGLALTAGASVAIATAPAWLSTGIIVGGVGYLSYSVGSSISSRYSDGQSASEIALGTLGDNTPAGSIYTGITNRDFGTGENLNLSAYEQGQMFGSGVVDLAGFFAPANKGVQRGINNADTFVQNKLSPAIDRFIADESGSIKLPFGRSASIADLPTLQISASKYPGLVDNILNAQLAGHPDVLTYGGNPAVNRAAALDGVPNIAGLSRDEYPFASTLEGGAGSWVGHIPSYEQNAQGGMLKNFYQQNNIQPGNQFRVNVGE